MFKYNIMNSNPLTHLWRLGVHTTEAMTPGLMFGWMHG
jgi:hypothetical protein